ncbi:hypothetical protein [Moheibacter sediminis]|uniref:Uncharacterized protein n=1 Tax=Moheibacter sediminis TaxID=1434700 RepID=A0A1W1YBS3_9FLAO|nr:hypothetical protein [Moheibacter sediminis]SMC33261.1 hypothetical protein SAMN06296427_101196 [Moheibacter sediminis]
MTKYEFLDENIFQGLENLNTGFDARGVKYFSESDFEIVLSRVEKLGLGIYGIEPWVNEWLFDVYTAEDYSKKPSDPKWYKSAFKKFKRLNKDLLYAASYEVPEFFLV